MFTCLFEARQPDGGLADSSLAVDQQRRRRVGRGSEERTEGLFLGGAAGGARGPSRRMLVTVRSRFHLCAVAIRRPALPWPWRARRVGGPAPPPTVCRRSDPGR